MASLLLPGCLPFEFLERAQEGQQGLALLGGQVDHLLPCRRRLAAVPEHRLEQTPRAPVVQKAVVAVDRLGEADPPDRRDRKSVVSGKGVKERVALGGTG